MGFDPVSLTLMGVVTGVASIASTGLAAAGNIAEGNAKAAGSRHQAEQAENAAAVARANADNTNAYYNDNLRKTLANIDAIRASAGVDPDSQTGQAIREENTRVSDMERTSKVYGIRAQASQDQSDAQFYRDSAGTYSSLGYLKGAGTLASGIAKGFW